MVKRLIQTWNKTNLMKRIAIGIFVGALLALLFPKASAIGLLGAQGFLSWQKNWVSEVELDSLPLS